MHAEAAYLFRHALLRDVAYWLQMPGERARMYALAFESEGGRWMEAMRLLCTAALAAVTMVLKP